MAMERAVVGSDVGGIRELLGDGEAGRVVEPENPRAIADCLAALSASESTRRSIGKAAREFVVRERDWATIVARYRNIYREALQLQS